jgi:hypothetical protein
MENINWTDRVGNAEVLHTVKEERNVIHTVKNRKGNWIGRILCRNSRLKQVIEGKIQRSRKGARRNGKVLDDKEKTECCVPSQFAI